MAIPQDVDFRVGYLYTTGAGEFGQLGVDAEEINVPTLVEELRDEKISQVVCGALQTYILKENGKVFSFGLNDAGSLGRSTGDDDVVHVPGQVKLPQACVQLAGGDSHCAALLTNGQVYAWGSFRILDGQPHGVDFRKDEEITAEPIIISQDLPTTVVKIASGAGHLVMLCSNGAVYTFGDGKCGQLGRKLPGTYRGDVIKHLLQPTQVQLVQGGRRHQATNIWTGEYTTFIQCRKSFWVCGANNWHQCGVSGSRDIVVYPKSKNELSARNWKNMAGGEMHTLAVDMDGVTYSFGRNVEGQCGIGGEQEDSPTPTIIPALKDMRVKKVAAGCRTSFAITRDGILFGWGIGEYIGLGDVESEYHFEPVQLSRNNEVSVSDVDGGSQHSAMVMMPLGQSGINSVITS